MAFTPRSVRLPALHHSKVIGFWLFVSLMLFSIMHVPISNAQDVTVKTGRYTLAKVSADRGAADPLEGILTTSISRDIVTIGHAIEELLYGSSYSLGRNHSETIGGVLTDSILLNLPLPDTQRDIGPMPLIDMIRTIAGPAWSVSVSQLARKIYFSPSVAVNKDEASIIVSEIEGAPFTIKAQLISTHDTNR